MLLTDKIIGSFVVNTSLVIYCSSVVVSVTLDLAHTVHTMGLRKTMGGPVA